jgi:hypothetical protein
MKNNKDEIMSFLDQWLLELKEKQENEQKENKDDQKNKKE